MNVSELTVVKTRLKHPLEEVVQRMVCQYLKAKHKNVMFNSDMAGIKLTKGQAVKAAKLRSNKGFPDLVIYEPRKGYSGLFIELKKGGTRLVKKDGTPTDEHVLDQITCINRLIDRGYKSKICIGYDQAIEAIEDYLKPE